MSKLIFSRVTEEAALTQQLERHPAFLTRPFQNSSRGGVAPSRLPASNGSTWMVVTRLGNSAWMAFFQLDHEVVRRNYARVGLHENIDLGKAPEARAPGCADGDNRALAEEASSTAKIISSSAAGKRSSSSCDSERDITPAPVRTMLSATPTAMSGSRRDQPVAPTASTATTHAERSPHVGKQVLGVGRERRRVYPPRLALQDGGDDPVEKRCQQSHGDARTQVRQPCGVQQPRDAGDDDHQGRDQNHAALERAGHVFGLGVPVRVLEVGGTFGKAHRQKDGKGRDHIHHRLGCVGKQRDRAGKQKRPQLEHQHQERARKAQVGGAATPAQTHHRSELESLTTGKGRRASKKYRAPSRK